MKNTYISWLVLSLSAALVGACGSSTPTPKKAAAIPVPNLGLVPMPRDISGATGAFRLDGTTDVVSSGGAGAASAAAYFVELATGQQLVALSKPEEGKPGSGDIAFVLAGSADPAT